MTSTNLDLDFDVGRKSKQPRARVYMALACSYLKDGGAPTLTADCEGYQRFEREVNRLRGELDSILERAEARFQGKARSTNAGPEPARAEGASGEGAEPRTMPRLGADLRVSDLMTHDVKTLGRNDKVSMADELMKVGRFRHIVVLDEEGRVVGVVSHRNIFYGALAWSIGLGRVAHQKELESHPVKDVMESDPVTVQPDTPLSEAAETMMEKKIGCLPVVDADQLVGILTEGDFLAMLAAGG